jgi:hypothetical protein
MTVSRPAFLSTGATLLAGFTADAAPASGAAAAGSGVARAAMSGLAPYRPPAVSRVDHPPTPARFAADRPSLEGGPQWIAVDLRAPCEIEAVTLVFDGEHSDAAGDEIPAGAATSFTLDVSADGTTWQSVYQTASGPGGEVDIPLSKPVTAQYVRMTSTARSNAKPVGLNRFQAYGTCPTRRPQATGWTNWGAAPRPAAEHAPAVQISPMPHPGTPGDKAGNRDHVRLSSTGDAVIGDPHVSTTLPNLPDISVAQVTIAVPVSNAGAATRTITVTAAFDDVTVSDSVSVAAGQSATVTFTPADHPQLTVHRPRLWWPNGYGEPALHDLDVTASVDGTASDRRGCRFGIREFGYCYDEPVVISPPGKSPLDFTDDRAPQTLDLARQQARYVRVQCGTRATQWGDSIWTLSVFDTAGSAPTADLALNQTATASCVGNSSAGPGNAVDGNPNTRWSYRYEDDQWIQLDFGSPRTFDQVLVVWGQAYPTNYAIQVSNDGSAWTDVLDVDNTVSRPAISCNGVKIFCRGGDWVGDELPDRTAQTAAMFRDMNFTMIRNRIGGGDREGLYAACAENGILVWNDFYDEGVFPNDRLGAPDTLADLCTEARFADYENMRAIFEERTANLWRNTSAVLPWMSHPARHSTARQARDLDGAYYGARKGCEPLHIQANPTTWQTLAANHTPGPVTGATITASVYGLDGTLFSRAEQQGLNIPAASTAPGLTVAWPPSLPDLHLVRLRLADARGTPLSQNTYWRSMDAVDTGVLNNLGRTRLAVRLSGSGETGLTATITNRGPVVAAMVRLSLLDEDGARILPARYGDNYLWLLPGESREVAVGRPDGSAFGGRPRFVAQACNSAAVSAS